MSHLKFINDLSKVDRKKLVDSFDYVFLDIDGVLALSGALIPGAVQAVAKLREIGKRIAFVTNNSVYPIELLIQRLEPFGVQKGELITPNDGLLAYLEKIGFQKDIYVISCSWPKKLLKKAGYNVIEYKDIQSVDLEETFQATEALSIKALEKCHNVGVVHVDFDFNLHIGEIQVAEEILNHIKDVKLLVGMGDDTVNVSKSSRLVGAKFYIDGLERWSKVKSVQMGKPGDALKEVLNLKYPVSDASRVLFVGDNVYTDIAFGVNCGYQTLLVLSGVTSKSQVDQWEFPENLKASYVASSIGELHEIIEDLYKN